MKIWTMTITRNNADVLPWFLAHYGKFCERMIFWDDQSTDGTVELLKSHPRADVRAWPFDTGLDDDAFLRFTYAAYRTAHPGADWVMWVDADEFIYAPNVPEALRNAARHTTVCHTTGYNMSGDGMPAYQDGKQIYDLLPMGVPAPVYSKPVIFEPRLAVTWSRGKHQLETCDGPVSKVPFFKLLHYRYLGADYTRKRNANNYERVGSDKAKAWTCGPDYDDPSKEHSPAWADAIKAKAVNVIELPI